MACFPTNSAAVWSLKISLFWPGCQHPHVLSFSTDLFSGIPLHQFLSHFTPAPFSQITASGKLYIRRKRPQDGDNRGSGRQEEKFTKMDQHWIHLFDVTEAWKIVLLLGFHSANSVPVRRPWLQANCYYAYIFPEHCFHWQLLLLLFLWGCFLCSLQFQLTATFPLPLQSVRVSNGLGWSLGWKE